MSHSYDPEARRGITRESPTSKLPAPVLSWGVSATEGASAAGWSGSRASTDLLGKNPIP